MSTTDMAKKHRLFKAFCDYLTSLRYVAIYPVCWGEEATVYSQQLKGTQAHGYTCVHCDQLPGDTDATAFVPIGHVLDTEGCSSLFRHIECPKGDH